MADLKIIDYLKTPYHYTFCGWSLVEAGTEYDEILDEIYYSLVDTYNESNGIEPGDDQEYTPELEKYINENLLHTELLLIRFDLLEESEFKINTVFLSALLDDLDVSEETKIEMFTEIQLNKNALIIRFKNFPRRIDLFPLNEPSPALAIFEQFDEDVQDFLQWKDVIFY